jgi:hypothetical protein
MRPCTLLEVKLGDVRDQSPAQIFEADTARGVRGLRWGDLHGCRACELASRCTRCYAVALAEAGDALAPYPSACATARATAQLLRSREDAAATLRFVAADSRSVTLGPYRRIAPDLYEAFEEPKTPEDDALAQRLGWVRRPEPGKHEPGLAVRPGELIQIRRPGKSSKLERVPGVGDHGHAANSTNATDQQANPSSERPQHVNEG